MNVFLHTHILFPSSSTSKIVISSFFFFFLVKSVCSCYYVCVTTFTFEPYSELKLHFLSCVNCFFLILIIVALCFVSCVFLLVFWQKWRSPLNMFRYFRVFFFLVFFPQWQPVWSPPISCVHLAWGFLCPFPMFLCLLH